MFENQERDACVLICVETAENISYSREISSAKFSVELRLNEKVVHSRQKRGNNLLWDDYYTYNLNDVEADDLEVALFGGKEEIGSTNLSYHRMKREMKSGQKSTVRLEDKNGKHTADLILTVKRYQKEEIIGGLQPIKVTLRPGEQLDDSFIQVLGLEKNIPSKANLFSCMDSNELEWQFFPKKFKTKINS